MEIQAAGPVSSVDPAMCGWEQPLDGPSSDPLVHVIDDDDSFRRSMLRILHASGYAAVGYGCAGEFLLALHGENTAGCILLDISMPGPSGIDLLHGLMQRGSAPPILFVTARDDVMTSVDAMKQGAFDYIVKPASSERVLAVVARALQVDARRTAAQRQLRTLYSRFVLLTDTERAVFAGVLSHRLNKQMAGDLGTCERTVKAMRARMMTKLRVDTVPELVRAAALLEGAGVSLAPRGRGGGAPAALPNACYHASASSAAR
jgi:two-component system, LuxR family, response regulator FixJ